MDYKTFESEMKEQFPKLFSKSFSGFSIGEGWFPIVKSLCHRIQHHIDWMQEKKEEYQQGEGCEQVLVLQVKEKFGGLRFYYQGGDDVVFGMVQMAESWAAHSCEVCGSPGEIRRNGWVRVLCEEHSHEKA